VDNVIQFIHEIEAITDGYHKWNGAAPNFNIKLMVKIVCEIYEKGKLKVNIILDINNILEPNAWFRKYFTPASVSWYCDDINIIGIKHNMLISIASHINIQFVLEIADKVLVTSKIYISV